MNGKAASVLVLNQHGDNRGDEAALRAMLAAIEERAGRPVRFTILHQFAGLSEIPVPQDVRWISLVPTALEAARLAVFAALLRGGLEWTAVLGRWGKTVVAAYREADIAVSAPGGPYLGDPYPGHEMVHWFYIWLAQRYRLPLTLYAPSVGPFRKHIRNPLRRYLFRRFRSIAVREDVSLAYLRELLGQDGPPLVLAADAALQRPVAPLGRNEYFRAARAALAERPLVGVAAMRWTFPGDPDPAGAQARYEEVLLDALVHLHRRHGAHLLLVPQLYGRVHDDAGYLRSLGARLPAEVSWELVDPAADSDYQQRLFGMLDAYLASRYHPQVFAVSQAVPGVCIYYQHKALGFLRQFGLDRLAFPIDRLDGNALKAALDEVLARRSELRATIAAALPGLRRLASRPTDLVIELLAERAQ